MLHPFTNAPTITASTGPAAPPEIRLENEERRKENNTLSLRGGQPHEGSLSSSSPRPIAEEERVVPVGSAANVALSLRQQAQPAAEPLPPNPLNNSDQDFRITKLAMDSMAVTGEGRVQTALNAYYKIPDDVNLEEGGRTKIVDVEVKPDPLFQALMGEAAEMDARPKTCVNTGKKQSNHSTYAHAAMPPIQMQMRTKIDIKLNSIGHIRPVTTDYISLFEPDESEPNLYPLRLTTVGKCKPEDPCPLMPSAIPPLFLTQNNEPVRDRDKVWRLDSERRILGENIDVTVGRVHQEFTANRQALLRGEEYDYRPPLIPGCYPRGGHESRELVYSDEAGSLISRERQWRGACLISRTYCILTAYGMGIAGRVHAPGLHIPRYILLEAYSKEVS